jgi:hypothetical protein
VDQFGVSIQLFNFIVIVCYFITFVSTVVQVRGLIGTQGILPFDETLRLVCDLCVREICRSMLMCYLTFDNKTCRILCIKYEQVNIIIRRRFVEFPCVFRYLSQKYWNDSLLV